MTEMPIREGRPSENSGGLTGPPTQRAALAADSGTGQWRTDPPTPVVEEPRTLLFWQVLLLGLVTVLFGCVVLVWPDMSVHVLGLLTGIWLLIGGAVRIVSAFVYWRGAGWQVLSGITGVLFLVAGVACLRDVAKGVAVLAFVIALVWLCGAMVEFVAAVQASGRSRTWRVVLGLAATAMGFVFLLWPGPSLTVLLVLAGLSALLIGAVEIAFASQVRRDRATA